MNAIEVDPSLPTATSDEKSMAMLSHLLMIFAWFIPPLVIYLVKRDSKFVAFHAMQGLLWQIAMLVIYACGFIGFFVSMFLTMPQTNQAPGTSSPFPVGTFVFFGVFWILMLGMMLANLILGIVYCIKASQGEWAAIPLFGRWARRIVGV